MHVRTDTPDAWLTCGLERARRTTSSTISSMNRGTSTCTPLPLPPSARSSQAFCSVICDALVHRLGIVRADDRADAVLQRRDDPAAVGVVLGVGAEDQADVQVQPDRIAADLDVALFQHVEQADLDPRREVGQLVDAKIPRLVRGIRPKCIVNSSDRYRPSACLTRSISPIRSAIVTSGVASFSW